MKIILTRTALRELDDLLDYLSDRSPQGAQRVKATVWSRIRLLRDHPFAGHTTDRPGLRRILATPYPYAILYRVTDNAVVVIQGIRHTARRPLV